ncbi:MAG: hypothetical protein ABSA44_10340 [Bacteroidota bacterium]|jgi:hypothetical protein
MDEHITKYLGKQAVFGSNQISHPIVERAILRDGTLIIDWVDEKHNRILVTIKKDKGDEWTGKFERGENPEEKGSVKAAVFFKENNLGILGKLLTDSGDSDWYALFEQVERFPDEK